MTGSGGGTEDSAILTSQELGLLRHSLRTPINQIVGYAELLLEEPGAPAALRSALATALVAVREGLARISAVIPATATSVSAESLAFLRGDLESARDRILLATDDLAGPSGAPLGAEVASDIARIRAAAEQLPLPVQPLARRPVGDAPPAAPGPLPYASPAAVPRRAAPRGRILVVDDTAENRDVFERRLRFEGHEVVCADGGEAALALAAAQPFDLILLDVMMPDLDGREVLVRLRADPATAEIPVVMISALDDVATAVDSIERGADDFITKPFDPVLLRARVGASIERVRLRQAEREYLRDVRHVTDAAEAFEDRRYLPDSLALVAGRADELGRLARVVDSLATQVRQREERLHAQVRTLREEVRTVSTGAKPADTKHDAIPVGTVLSERYEIVRVIGRGGMGVVYEARDRQLAETVALKVLNPSLLDGDPGTLERFKSEIRLARRITHENVVRSHDFGEADGVCFVTMELVQGVTVRELLTTRGKLGVDTTLAIAAQLARALDAAHRQGVVHRDIKPDNIILDGNGVLKVMDFGIARFAAHMTTLTSSGITSGTPAYMAPEQLLEEPVDERTDLYATGVVLFECLTGRLPFVAANPIALIAKLLHSSPPDPAESCPDAPPALAATVRALLAKVPNDRPPTAARLGELLMALG
jgi:DNA-binding response OmpR family regulator